MLRLAAMRSVLYVCSDGDLVIAMRETISAAESDVLCTSPTFGKLPRSWEAPRSTWGGALHLRGIRLPLTSAATPRRPTRTAKCWTFQG